ncbi:hypothetical protein RAL92_12235 [Metapseudomonas otitidis]|uniref:hypothetical protein n=1 Tax=Metapseudomonas otitidis TaxID=319939 RepID=UPI003216E99C
MTLTPDDIARLFELYLPDHACGVTRQEDGAFTLQFTHRSRHDVLTVPGLAASQPAWRPASWPRPGSSSASASAWPRNSPLPPAATWPFASPEGKPAPAL